ncbi:MAG: HIT family protein [Defluviitaleaceae bacterium]|nr:HIT family protein [Defluviitaleaceae bacterium]
MKNDCLFCAIVDGEIPSYKLYEDEYFYVILDRFPKCLGHTLILPKRHAAHIFSLNEEEAGRLFPLAQKVAAVLKEELDFHGLNLIQNNGAAAGQEVNHFHLHLIPRYENDAMAIQYRREDPSEKDFEDMAEKLQKVLG